MLTTFRCKGETQATATHFNIESSNGACQSVLVIAQGCFCDTTKERIRRQSPIA